MSVLYILEGHKAVPTDDIAAWVEWFVPNGEMCQVGKDMVGSYAVSTVFLGSAHSRFAPNGPTLFETAVFAPDDSLKIVGRYPTWEDAAEGHALAVAELLKSVLP